MLSDMRPVTTLLLAATLLPLTACGLIGADDVEPGEVVRAQEEAIDTGATGTRELELQLPEGRLTVTVGAPLDEVPAADTLGERDLSPAGGARLVPVTWEVDSAGTSTFQRSVAGPGTAPASLSLVAGDEPTVIDDRWRRTGAAYVAVPADGDLSVAIDYDGLTQRASVDGQDREVPAIARSLYDAPDEPADQACADVVVTGVAEVTQVDAPALSCRLALGEAAYVAGPGWADDVPWRVVEVSVDPGDVTAPDGSTYAATSAEETITLNGAEPVATVSTVGTTDDGLGEGVVVFPGGAAASEVGIRRTFALTKVSGSGPANAAMTVSSTTAVG